MTCKGSACPKARMAMVAMKLGAMDLDGDHIKKMWETVDYPTISKHPYDPPWMIDLLRATACPY